MDVGQIALLAGAGFIGGIVNALAGGATLITFPAMLMAGLPPVIANASNAVAISPGHVLAVLADREKLSPLRGVMGSQIVAAAFGGAAGAFVLLAIPERYFVLPVPALIGFATLLFALAPAIQGALARRRIAISARTNALWIALASLYGGFFGAGLGIILTAVIALSGSPDIRTVKADKNLLAAAVSATAVLIFIVQGVVAWGPTGVMLAGALFGGFAGGVLNRILPGEIVRWTVIVTGVAMTLIYAVKYWT